MQNVKLDLVGRKVRGYEIIAKGDIPEKVKRGTWLVPSQSKNIKYMVTHHAPDVWVCDCPDCQKNDIDCKHIHSVRFYLMVKEKVEKNDIATKNEEQKYSISVCPHCHSEKIIKRGIRKNKFVNKQRFSCKDCGKKFVLDVAKRTKGDAKIITLCLDLFFKGISCRKIQDHLNQFYGFEISHATINRWIRKFMKMANQHAKAMMPKTSDMWHADEQMIKCNGNYLWLWNVLDNRTKFLLANNITKDRFITDARVVFNKAKPYGIPTMVVTDGLMAYRRAIKKEFLNVKKPLIHIKADGITSKKKNNNVIERFHGTFRERDKVMRGFKGKNNADFMTEVFQTYYNFVRPHQSLNGLTPSQRAGISNVDRNRWIGLLK